jgi:hypothetical protein
LTSCWDEAAGDAAFDNLLAVRLLSFRSAALPAAGCAFFFEGFAVFAQRPRDLSRRLRYGLFETFDVYGLVGRNDVRHGYT